MLEDLDKLKLAIEVEVAHRYIDIHGKTQPFSKFIKSVVLKEYNKSKKIQNGQFYWKHLNITLTQP